MTHYKFTSSQPPEHLRMMVKNFFTLHYDKDVVHNDYLLPDGLPSLFYIRAHEPVTLYLGKRSIKLRQGFHAAYSNTIVKFKHGRFSIAGASVLPVHFHQVSGKSLPEIMNRFVRLDESVLMGGRKVPARPTTAWILARISRYMTTQLTRNGYDETFLTLYQSLTRPGGYDLRIDALAEKLGYTTRSLHTHFRAHFGMPPKKFIKLIRFSYALKHLYNREDHWNLSSIAHEAGYHDQSHLIRDFKSISGKTPREIADSAMGVASNFRLF